MTIICMTSIKLILTIQNGMIHIRTLSKCKLVGLGVNLIAVGRIICKPESLILTSFLEENNTGLKIGPFVDLSSRGRDFRGKRH